MKFKALIVSLIVSVSVDSYARMKPQLVAQTNSASGTVGQRYKVGWVNVVTLNGDFNTMGQQYGSLMQNEILTAYDLMVQKMFLDKNITTFKVLKEKLFDTGWPSISSRQKALFQGISAASGLSLEKVFILDQINIALVALSQHDLPPSLPGCSYIAVWGPFTRDGSVILARNLDWFAPFASFSPLMTVVVYKPTDGSQFVANIGYAGWVNALTAFNDRGQFLELNNGMGAMGFVWHKDRVRFMNELLEMLFDSDSKEALERRIATVRPEFANIINVADSNSSTSFENAPQQMIRREGDFDGLLVATNNYLSPYWGIEVFESPTLSLTRREHLLALAQAYKGIIDATVMKTIMEQPLQFPNGTIANGATMYISPEKGVPAITVYTVVAKPSTETMWIRVPKVTAWQEIDYGYFFRN